MCYSFDLLNKRVKNVDENGMELSDNSFSFCMCLCLFLQVGSVFAPEENSVFIHSRSLQALGMDVVDGVNCIKFGIILIL